MTIRFYDLTTCTCSVTADDLVHETMAHYLSAHQVSKVDHPDVELDLCADADAVTSVRASLTNMPPDAIRRSHPEQRYLVWTTGTHHEILLPERTTDHVITTTTNRVGVTADRIRTAATIGIRIVRQLIMRGGEARDGRAVHAGAIDIDGAGVLVGGHPGAGKTSVLTRLVEDHGARSVANDRTVLAPSGDGSWMAAGVPLAWRFTPEGVDGSPRLAASVRSRRLARGHGLVDGKVELTPLEISRILDRPVIASTQVTRVVILVRSPDGAPRTPDPVFLRERLDFGEADFFAEDWLDLRSRLDAPPATERSNVHDWWAKVASAVPIKVLTWANPTELARVAAAVAGAPR
ncbi:hypothetical protein [Actinophytocola sp.]|uniref:hypothetical protein n=1 Tax=Actinophytocola sp. TaxID=1872138 RepID=UPI003D6BD3DF